MPYSRYNSRQMFTNARQGYKKVFFEKRDIEQVEQYATGRFIPLRAQARTRVTNVPMTWTSTLRIQNIAHEHYGSAEYWWVICLYNNKGSVFDFSEGEIFYIPKPIDDVLNMMGV